MKFFISHPLVLLCQKTLLLTCPRIRGVCVSKGDSLAEVSKEMGHGSPDITYRTYYKWMPKLSVSNIDELDKRMVENATIRNRIKKGVKPMKANPLNLLGGGDRI